MRHSIFEIKDPKDFKQIQESITSSSVKNSAMGFEVDSVGKNSIILTFFKKISIDRDFVNPESGEVDSFHAFYYQYTKAKIVKEKNSIYLVIENKPSNINHIINIFIKIFDSKFSFIKISLDLKKFSVFFEKKFEFVKTTKIISNGIDQTSGSNFKIEVSHPTNALDFLESHNLKPNSLKLIKISSSNFQDEEPFELTNDAMLINRRSNSETSREYSNYFLLVLLEYLSLYKE